MPPTSGDVTGRGPRGRAAVDGAPVAGGQPIEGDARRSAEDGARPPRARAVSEGWTLLDKPFLLSFKGVRLGAVNLRMAIFAGHFTTLSTDPNALPIPFEELSDRVDVFVVRPQPVAEELPLVTVMPRAVRYVPWHYERTYADLSTTFDEYAKRFSSKHHKAIKRMHQRFKEHAGSEEPIVRYEGVEGITEFHRLAREVAKKTYQERLEGGGLPGTDDYLREMRRLASEGKAWGYLLMHGPKPVAYVYVVAHQGVLYFESTGYDAEYSKFSPGRNLLYHVHKDVFAMPAGYPVFDYGEQEGSHKDFFGTTKVRVANCFYYVRRPKPLAVLGAELSLHYARKGARIALDKLDLEYRAGHVVRRGTTKGAVVQKVAAEGDE